MDIFVHDYHGTPPHFDVSKYLSKNGYKVVHAYNPECGGPKTGFSTSNNKKLNIIENSIGKISKNNFLKRYTQEKKYGKKLIEKINKLNPDLLISANTPTDAEKQIVKYCLKNSIPHIFWLTDIRSIAANKILTNKLGALGSIIGKYYMRMEKKLLNKSSHIIYLNDAFESILNKWKISTSRDFIPIWTPINDINVYPKKNDFSKKHEIYNNFVILYSGSLGFKHNPDMIIEVAKRLKSSKEIKIVIVSEDRGVDFLKDKKNELKLDNLVLFPYQDYDTFPKVLASADILLTILNEAAAEFSVPSKVYSGLCSGRASLLAVPNDNLASRMVNNNNLGLVTKPDDPEGLVDKIIYLKNSPEERKKMGYNARRYAEKNFKIEKIGKKFENIFNKI